MDGIKEFILDMYDLENAEFPLNELFSLQINHNNVKYEFLIRFSSNNKNLICFGSGAFDPKKISPPIYNRFSWQTQFDESVIYYNDPTLYINPKVPLKWGATNLSLGWGVGKSEEWYLSIIADIIHSLALKKNIKHENILFFGSSGGGFTSIILATLIKNSAAMANNPQIFCKNLKDHFDNIIKTCFDDLDSETALTQYKYRFDVIEMFKRENYIPPITYLLNVNSEIDLLDHFVPFINSLPSLKFDNRVNVVLYQSEDGHNGVMDKEETIKMIKDHFKTNEHAIKCKNNIDEVSSSIEYQDYLLNKKNYEGMVNKFKNKLAKKVK